MALAVSCVVASVGVAGQPPAGAAGTGLAPTSGKLVNRWAAFNQIPGQVSPSAAAAVAGRFDLVVVKSSQKTVVAAMKAANPRLVALVYHNGTWAQKSEGTKYPAAWYAHDAAGRKITQTVFGNYLMDVSNPEWVQHAVDDCRASVAKTNADGCYTDMLMTAPLFGGYASGKPVNPATGRNWTFADFQQAVDGIGARIRDEVDGPSAANGVGAGKRWFATDGSTSKPLTDSTDAAHSEIWIRDRSLGATAWESAAEWLQDVRMVAEAEAEGRQMLVETKLWKPAGAALTEQWRHFTLASFLLATSGHSWYLFTPTKDFAGMTDADPELDVAVGTPTGPFAQQGGAWVRGFTTGFVAVNPDAAATTVTLPAGSWKDLAGNVASGTVALPAHTGSVWTAATA